MNIYSGCRLRKSLGGLLALAALALAPGSAQASCKQGICVHGRDGPKVHVVEFTSTFTNVHHYNVSSPWVIANGGGHQFEVGRNVRSFAMKIYEQTRPLVIDYSIQACAYGGFPAGSNCGPWVTFRHTMR